MVILFEFGSRLVLPSLLLLLLILSNGLISSATGEEADVNSGQQITTITTSSSEPCVFNRFCTCVTENIQSVAPKSDSNLIDSALDTNSSTAEDLLSSLNIDQPTTTIYSHSKLYEITCLNSPFYSIPKIPGGHLYRLNLIGAKQLSRIKSSSFVQAQISSITISRSKVQVVDNDAFQGSESTLTALDLSLNELTEFPSAALKRLPILQWLNLKGNRIEEIRANDLFATPSKEAGRYRARRSLNRHRSNIRRSRRRRVRREEELTPTKVDWIAARNGQDLKAEEQIFLRRTSRKRHFHTKSRKTQNKRFPSNDRDHLMSIDDGYQNDESAHQVLKEDTPDNQEINQTDQIDQQTESVDHGVLSLRSLLLSDNYLTSVTGQIFASLTNLDALDLDNNLISKIEGKPFPVSLSSLSLANNLLEKLPTNSLRPLKQLKWLQLRGNMLKNLPEEWPFSTNQIEILDLSRNLISSLNGFFSHSSGQKQTRSKITLYTKNDQPKQHNSTQQLIVIKDLLLDNNLMRNLPEDTFASCQLERLVLSNNRLSKIVSNLFINSPLSNSLKILDLSNNQIEQVDDSLTGLKKLQSLFIRNNQLKHLDESTFKSSSETLQIIDLSGNQFTQVPYESFQPIKHLLKLNLQNNQIRCLTRHDFQQWAKSLLSLQLNKNQIEQIDRETFKFASNLRELRIASNKLHNISPEMFVPLGRKLSILELNDLGEMRNLHTQVSSQMMTANLSSSIKEGISKLKNIEFLELNHNRLNEITGRSLSSLSNLVHLDLEGNDLEDLNDSFFNSSNHTKLRNIILTDNKFESVESYTFAHLRQVINIALIGNQLKIIESNAFSDLPQLSTILLSRNRLKTIRSGAFNGLRNLRNLFMQHNQLEELSLDIFNITDMLIRNKMMLNDEQPRAFNFNANSLTGKLSLQNGQLANQLNNQFNNGQLSGLHLNASHNRIKQLNGLSRLKSKSNTSSQMTNEIEAEDEYQLNLSVLDLSDNQLIKLSVQFFQIIGKNLIKLILNSNQLDSFPVNSLNQCPNLQLISMRNNKIQNLNSGFNLNVANRESIDYSNLQLLDLAFNEISNLTTYRPILSTATKLIYLDVSNNRISNLVDNIFNGTSIQHLDLSTNQLTDLPFTLNCYGAKDSLVSLILDSNQLSSLPKELNTCTNLHYLSIRKNQLTEIGNQAFFKLEHLLHLDLSGNTFYSIQIDAFDRLTNLRKLFLNSCNLDSTPSLNDCSELVELDLSNNSLTLTSLQQPLNPLSKFNSIFKCRKLKTLNLSSNQLTEVPRQLSKYLTSITELDLSSNPIELLDSSSLADLKILRIIDIRNLQLKFVENRVFHNHRYLTYIKTSTYPNVRSFRLYDLLAKMFSVRRALIHVEESVLSHQLQWAFGSKIKELTITGQNLMKILPDAFLGLYHTTDFTLRITKTNITELPAGLLRYLTLTDLKYISIDLSSNKLISLNRDVLFFGKDKTKTNLFTGGLQVQRNQFKCGCDLLWLKDWYERWLRESRKAQLVSHEHYLRNYQTVDQVTCLKENSLKNEHRIEPSIKLDFLKFLPHTFELSNMNSQFESSKSNRTMNKELAIFNLNEHDLKCSNNVNSPINHLTYLINAILFYWLTLFMCQLHL